MSMQMKTNEQEEGINQEQKAKRRINRIQRWLKPDRDKDHIQKEKLTQQQKQFIFPSEEEIITLMNDKTNNDEQILKSQEIGPIKHLDRETRQLIYDRLIQNRLSLLEEEKKLLLA
jgi:transposase